LNQARGKSSAGGRGAARLAEDGEESRRHSDRRAAAGVRHHVALSVVGTQRLTESGYFRAKIVQEELITDNSIPYSIVHATRFFEFVKGIADIATEGDTVRLAPVLIQPMAAEDVATFVSGVAVGAPVNGIVEIAGPELYRLDELVRRFFAARGDPRSVIADPHARYSGAELGERTLLPDNARLGEIRFDDWLSQSVSTNAPAVDRAPPQRSEVPRAVDRTTTGGAESRV
jgi:uncharacterized protein YbjT (DUF2867 family)